MTNEYCHNSMKCQKGCPCAGKDGFCHCPMVNDEQCACQSHCREQEKKSAK